MLYSPENAYLLGIFDFVKIFLFLAAFLLLAKNWREQKSVFIVSGILLLNIIITAETFSIFIDMDTYSGTDFYLRWVQFDSLSIIAIIIIHLLFRIPHSRVASVVMYLLIINVFFFLAMHIDIIESGNRTHWWLWDLYTPTINIVRLSIVSLMIISAIINMKNKQAIARRFADSAVLK
ncbi:hypothetical protein [Thalassomonas actiniarum]|uniref:Uncharacterized protein n=1 Tax=Thalassomonas actiniarum TaxID=485447 RepID=A0AAF0C4I6_9GAMM|nr:hypothetical protein [Thalassomonas actiniarum]WDD99864.1 hypothetical protein SG35_004130 [Thalassomonas actiniarum]